MKKIIIVLCYLAAVNAGAVVDMKNANFVDTWTDLVVPGSGYDLKVQRTYNSRSLFNGIFGFGWCSDFETSVKPTPEGNLLLTECGGGLEVIFTPANFDPKEINRTVDKIVAKLKENKKNTEAYIKDMQSYLLEDVVLRTKNAQRFGITANVTDGTTFYANGRQVENFIYRGGFYLRTLPDGTAQKFDREGHLVQMFDKNQNFLKFTYEKDLIRDITDNSGRKLDFKYHQNRKISQIIGPNNLSAQYQYKNLDDLSQIKNAWGTSYSYNYDEGHNLTKITYPDKSTKELSYIPKKDWVVSFKDRNNCLENYNYESSKDDPDNHYWSTVEKTCDKKVVNNSRYEFWYRNRPDGQKYLHRVLTRFNDNENDITYHPIFGRPLSIRNNSDTIKFTYHENGLVKSKETPVSRMLFNYDDKTKKVAEVSADFLDDKGKKVSQRKTKFRYDPKGNLIYAENTDGQKVKMTYDSHGRIATIEDQAKRNVQIKYEERFGKPAFVTREGVGTIAVSYNADGSIKKVDSKMGPTVAVQVASTFNNLLDIIAPATSELNL